MKVYTIGYEGADIMAFIETLQRVGIQHVIDIRDLPASRRRDFSKNILRDHLAARDIGYSHLKALGDPKSGREAMRRGDTNSFRAIFQERLDTDEAKAALDAAITMATQTPSVLLCYERDPKSCHRTIVAQIMEQESSFVVRHLGVQSPSRMAAREPHAREYQPAC